MPTTIPRSATMAATAPTLATYTVAYTAPSGMLTERPVTAAYFREDGRLTVFKDADNQAMYAVRTDSLVSIERPAVDDQAMTAFTQALRQANTDGSATVGYRNGDTEQATGRSTETGYDITVVRIDN